MFPGTKAFQQLFFYLHRHRLGGQLAQRGHRIFHLMQIVSAGRTQTDMHLETNTLRKRKGALQILRDQSSNVLAGEIASQIAHQLLPEIPIHCCYELPPRTYGSNTRRTLVRARCNNTR